MIKAIEYTCKGVALLNITDMILIDNVTARQILNSSGEPTIEAEVSLTDGTKVRGSAPTGVTKSSYANVDLLDKDFSKYFGKSVEHAVRNVNEIIAPRLKKLDPTEQFKVDQILRELDNTPNMAHLGTNSTMSVSIAVAKGAAKLQKKHLYEIINDHFKKVEVIDRFEEEIKLPLSLSTPALPIPAFNVINGGEHADTNVTIQEYMVIPVGIKRMADKVRAGAEIAVQIKRLLNAAGKRANVGLEGGYVADFEDNEEPLTYLRTAVHKTGYDIKNKVLYAIAISGADVEQEFIDNILHKYPIISIEDAYGQDDWELFRKLNRNNPNLFVTSDNLTAMKIDRLNKAIEEDSIDCTIVKPNQIGTVTDTLKYAKVAKDAGIELFISDRANDTNDTFIVDLAIGVGAKFLKAGAPTRGERVAKYNHLLDMAQNFEDPI